ncbi:PDC sensor domain-containing protein [Roseibium sp. SCP14]|uniref:PDC sensor domain-containing protein n=1 Tax=Roseibium sp. SCP14 TaxID=3141375 RepID=UPI0033372218
MKRILAVIALTTFLVGSASAQEVPNVEEINSLIDETTQSARINLLAAERMLFAADQALDHAAVITSSVTVDRLVHTELRRLETGVPGARAILVIGPDGQLLHDSYKYPVLPLDLSDRTYFKEAIAASDLVIGEQVIGRTSGSSFVPIVKRHKDLTFVAVTAPFALVDLQSECGDCWSLALKEDGTIVTMFPPESKILPDLIKRTANRMKSDGSIVIRYEHSVFSVVWRKSPDFPLISVSVRGLPDTAAVDVDIN